MSDSTLYIGIVLYDQYELIDAMGPLEVLGNIPIGTQEIYLVAQSKDPVEAYPQGNIIPDQTFESCPDLDVLVVPGGAGQIQMMENSELIDFLRRQANQAQYVVSVCTGALLLASAGLLDGHVATTHWNALCALNLFPEVTLPGSNPRYILSGNRLSSGGVTSGIDASLALVAMLKGDDIAKQVQLAIQYAPEPPFNCGTPETVEPYVWQAVSRSLESTREQRVDQITAIVQKREKSIEQNNDL